MPSACATARRRPPAITAATSRGRSAATARPASDAWLRTRAAPLRAAILLALPPGLAGAEPSEAVDAEAVMEAVARSFTPPGDAEAGSRCLTKLRHPRACVPTARS